MRSFEFRLNSLVQDFRARTTSIFIGGVLSKVIQGDKDFAELWTALAGRKTTRHQDATEAEARLWRRGLTELFAMKNGAIYIFPDSKLDDLVKDLELRQVSDSATERCLGSERKNMVTALVQYIMAATERKMEIRRQVQAKTDKAVVRQTKVQQEQRRAQIEREVTIQQIEESSANTRQLMPSDPLVARAQSSIPLPPFAVPPSIGQGQAGAISSGRTLGFSSTNSRALALPALQVQSPAPQGLVPAQVAQGSSSAGADGSETQQPGVPLAVPPQAGIPTEAEILPEWLFLKDSPVKMRSLTWSFSPEVLRKMSALRQTYKPGHCFLEYSRHDAQPIGS